MFSFSELNQGAVESLNAMNGLKIQLFHENKNVIWILSKSCFLYLCVWEKRLDESWQRDCLNRYASNCFPGYCWRVKVVSRWLFSDTEIWCVCHGIRSNTIQLYLEQIPISGSHMAAYAQWWSCSHMYALGNLSSSALSISHFLSGITSHKPSPPIYIKSQSRNKHLYMHLITVETSLALNCNI